MTRGLDLSDHQPRVLIVDDERHNRQLLEVMLASEGWLLQSVSSGEEALDVVSRQPPDLVLLDVMMPRMDGYEVTRAIKASPLSNSIPVIMLTALDDRDSRMRGLEAGAEDFLSKPVDRAELCTRVRNLLRLKAYGDYHDRQNQLLEHEVGSRTADLVDRERLYRSTFDAAPIGIVHVGLDGQWLRVNQRICDLLGYSRQELECAAAPGCLDPEEAPAESAWIEQLAAGTINRHVDDEKQYRKQDGSVMLARVMTSVYRDRDGLARHFIAVIEDITELRTLEAQLRQSHKMDAIGKLASGVAHDFNNLLTVIIGFGEVINADVTLGAQHRGDLGEIMKAARRASGLTKQLLAFSRQQVLNAVPLDVNELMSEMAGMVDRLIGDEINVTLALAPTLSLVLADRGQLEQVVMNLVVNARDAMPTGGTLTIETKDVVLENSAFHEETVESGPYVMLAVTDTGTGMSREIRRRLFEPFFTTKDTGRGTGLGLSTTYGIVKQSRGYICVYSEIGHGTTFKVYLPRASGEAVPEVVELAAVIDVAAAPAAPRGTQTVLLVEDEIGVRHLSKRILATAGYRVLEAGNGDEAEQVFAAHAAAIDLVITDVVMPGCGGPELLTRLQRRAPGLRVLYMSGYTEKVAAARAGIGGGLPFLQKPFTSVDFVRHVREALNR